MYSDSDSEQLKIQCTTKLGTAEIGQKILKANMNPTQKRHQHAKGTPRIPVKK